MIDLGSLGCRRDLLLDVDSLSLDLLGVLRIWDVDLMPMLLLDCYIYDF